MLLAGTLAGWSAGGWAEAPKPDLIVTLDCGGPQGALSSVTIAGKTFPWSNDESDMSRLKAALGDARTVHVRGEANTPYRCVGGLVFSLQRLGVTQVEFLAQPPSERKERP